jgi:phosphate-selective porin
MPLSPVLLAVLLQASSATPEAPGQDARFEARFADGLHWIGPGEEWDVHLGGRYLGNERIVFDQPEDSGYRTRQALVRLDAEGWKDFSFRITGDFTPVEGERAARLFDAYVQWRADPALTLTLGLVKMPVGTDRLMSRLFTEGVERPITATFQPSEEPGLRVFGSVARGVFRYDAAVSEGKSEILYSSTLDDSQLGLDHGTGPLAGKFYASAAVLPFAESSEKALAGLQLRIFASTNYTSGVDLFDAYRIKSPDFGISWLSPASGADDLFFQGHRILAGADPSWTAGPFLLRGEFLFRRDRVARPSTGVRRNLDVLSWSAVASWQLTGEDQAVGQRIPPAAPVDFSGPGWGSLDVHLRAAGAAVDKDALEALGTDLDRYTNRLTTTALGFNWWPRSNLRISLEGILEDYHQAIAVNSAAEKSRSLTGILMRFQIDF